MISRIYRIFAIGKTNNCLTMKIRQLLLTLTVGFTVCEANAQTAVHFDMSLTADGKITETVSGQQYSVISQLPAVTAAGPDGQALRFDGYSNYVKAAVPTATLSTTALTMSVVLAAETYPMMQVDVAEQTPTFATICGNVNETTKQGIALELSSQGDLRLRYGSASGFLMTVSGNEKLPRGQWCLLTAVMDKAANSARLYLNGHEIGSGRMSRQSIAHSSSAFTIGKAEADTKSGPFLINTFCGLIDDIRISNEVVDFTLIDLIDYSQYPADFNYPLERYTNVASSGAEGISSLWRPQFHAMPSGSWTNETHGMLYSGGRYHLFFQKNANGPYMSRLHWGHVSSADLCTWREEPIAIYPGESYDIKGCWSGCVYEREGTPYILYTAVDNERARIVQAHATDADLNHWVKDGIVIDGRPAGLSDDFRDPFFFEAGGQQYIIVGTAKGGIGACTLHKLVDGQWTNDGAIFFQGASKAQHGTFWEMPNVTNLGDGRWLFTCTPLGMNAGVRTLCWVGTIGTDGKFTPITDTQYLEMGGISRDGYGLLSPTILSSHLSPLTSHLLVGIVPDKLPTERNFEMGWAHNYSLPRELTVDAQGQLVQRPYSGLSALRSATSVDQQLTLQGTQSLAPVSGRQIELLGEFTVASGTCGFRFLQAGAQQASLTYDTDHGTLTLDITTLRRQANDRGVYDGVYTATLPTKVAAGEQLTLHLWLDGSIADIFVNDQWAFAVRIFPNDGANTGVEAFATAPMAAHLQAWTLDAQQAATGIKAITQHPTPITQHPSPTTCYNLHGQRVSSSHRGLVISDGRKRLKIGDED